MSALGNLLIVLLSSLCLYLLLTLIKVLHKLWWTPRRIQHLMSSQGIKGPPYRFIHGSTKEISKMRMESMKRPMDLSHDILPKVQPQVYAWTNKYGKNYLNWYGPQAQLIVTEPELIKEILNNRDGAYPRADAPVFVKKLTGNGLVTSEGENWVKHRKLANHAFQGDSLKSMILEMISSVEMMLARWKNLEGKEIEVHEEFKIMTSEIISRTAFGSSYLEGKNIFEMLMKLSSIANRNAYKIRLPVISKIWKTTDEIESDKLVKGIRDSVVEKIKKREEKVMTGEVDNFGTDFLGLLIDAHHDDDENKRLSIDDLVDECKTFYLAGQETTNSLLAWTVFLLAIHTEWQEEARKEVIQLFGYQNPDSDGIAKLKIMNMIINESLRLYPPGIGLIRKVGREVRLGKLILPANLSLYIANLAPHHDPQIWGEDVHLFKPERFSEGVAKATNNNAAAFFPFGLGPRSCVGFNFATMEAKVALSMILQRYSFTLSPTYIHLPFQLITLCPRHGIQVILHSLQSEG